ncbi:MAG: hypothetical protein K2X48_04115 [Chitinophagaceae bacterium]|nr:hypothetical protein [Chitinophagaceae bacterium]
MIKYILTILFFVTAINHTDAQQKPPTLTPPELQSFWSTTKGGSLPLEMVLSLVDSAVWVIDVKKVRYSVSRFVIVYRSKDKYEDEQTGEVKTRFNSNTVQIRNSPYLTEQWRKMLYENIKPGDELLITDLIARDKKGNFFRAPEVKIVIN